MDRSPGRVKQSEQRASPGRFERDGDFRRELSVKIADLADA